MSGADVVLFRTCRDCGITDSPLIDGPTTPWWAALDQCSGCLIAATSATVREMARRAVASRAAVRSEYREILDGHNEWFTEHWAGRDRAEHAKHWPWRRWRITHRLVGDAYQIGLISGSGSTFSASCRGCVSSIRWRGRRPYIAGWERERWSCLLVGRHRRQVIPGTSLCTVCAPCWVCRSSDPAHDAWACEIARDAERAQVSA